MRTEEEIVQKLEIYKKIRDVSNVFSQEFTLTSGAITALEWILEVKK